MLSNSTAMAVIAAHDLERARRFYSSRLGLEPSRHTAGGLIYEVGGSMFFLYETTNAGTAQNTVMSFMVADVRAEVDALKTRGVVFEEYDYPELRTVNSVADLNGELSAWFRDSEGNYIAISQLT